MNSIVPEAADSSGRAPLPPHACTSIIIPCYNYGRFLAEAIESALTQTKPALEIIVVNDGSSDNTEAVASHYPVRLINQANKGIAHARNAAIQNASGRFILPLDADDKIHNTFLEETTPILEQDLIAGVVFTHRQNFGLCDTVKAASEFNLERMKIKCGINYCSLYRKIVWEECRGYARNMDGYEDWDFWLSVAEKGWKFRLVPKVLFYYRKHGYSMIDRALANHDSLVLRLRQKHPNLFQERRQ